MKNGKGRRQIHRLSHHQSLPTNCVRSSRSRNVALRSSISFILASLSDCAIFSCMSEIRIWSCMIQERAEASFCSSGVSGELMLLNSSWRLSVVGGRLGMRSANLIIALIYLLSCAGALRNGAVDCPKATKPAPRRLRCELACKRLVELPGSDLQTRSIAAFAIRKECATCPDSLPLSLAHPPQSFPTLFSPPSLHLVFHQYT